VDNDLDGNPSEGEPKGVWYFPAMNQGARFVNGDGSAYFVNTNTQINLAATENQGAAMYIDGDGNKIFGKAGIASGEGSDSREAGNDILLMYQVENSDDAEFYQVDTNGNQTYFKIIRQIVQNESVNITSGVEEDPSGNCSDFLEEALWWRNQGFTAYEFAEIKTHAMTESLPVGSSPAAFGYATNYTERNTGYTLADDWHNNEKASFKSEGFTPSDYVSIVLGAHYVNGTWYSTYADYLLFKKLSDVGYLNDVSVDPDAITDMLPSTSEFNDPFGYDHKGNHLSEMFIPNVAHETELSDAMVFSSDRVAFMQMFQLGCSSADYIAWAEEFAYQVDQTETKYFRINHYIYYMQEDLASDSSFDADDLRWVLTPEVTKEIFYTTVTPEARTTDLVEYRRNWFNKDGTPYITFRDYCEWINIYAYSDKYRMDRGDIGMENEEIDQGDLTATDGWLSLESFAVWKRMEKYENNIEYLKNITDTTPEYEITAPILKRQISTTVFPRLDSSGEYKKDENGLTSYERRYLPQATTDSSKIDDVNDDIIKYYGWDQTDASGNYIFEKKLMPIESQRHVNDRYEYNEYYIIRSDIERTLGNDEKLDSKEVFYKIANEKIIHDTKYAKECDILCGGLVNPCACQDHTHAAYHVRQWEERYGLAYYEGKLDSYSKDYKGDAMYALKLDEFKINEYYLGFIYEKVPNGFDPYGNPTYAQIPRDQKCIIPDDRSYAQLYVPYDVFKWACQTIKSQFPDSAGYKNYMKFWARNGAYNWICDTSEYDGPMGDEFVKVQYTYRAHNFWTHYDGTLSPVDGSFMKAVGWE
ncbi:MAG: hypothetical protein IKT33_02695, partial [Clostridia bacterium]|nr:hypothetical protein [Clostridia bacterium]